MRLSTLAGNRGVIHTITPEQLVSAATSIGVDLTVIDEEDQQSLLSWTQKYSLGAASQAANLRRQITSPAKHLALDLAGIMKGGQFQRSAGLSSWAKIMPAPEPAPEPEPEV